MPSLPDEGYIKFTCLREDGSLPDAQTVAALNDIREELFRLKLTGMGEDGIGYGNLSMRLPGSSLFIISATRTGGKPLLNAQDFVTVTDVNIPHNTVRCTGQADASSETMSHAALYAADFGIGAVLHVHHAALWEQGKDKYPTTPPTAAYGTPEMALTLMEASTGQEGIIIMGGHQDGIMAYGPDLHSAWKQLEQALNLLEKSLDTPKSRRFGGLTYFLQLILFPLSVYFMVYKLYADSYQVDTSTLVIYAAFILLVENALLTLIPHRKAFHFRPYLRDVALNFGISAFFTLAYIPFYPYIWILFFSFSGYKLGG